MGFEATKNMLQKKEFKCFMQILVIGFLDFKIKIFCDKLKCQSAFKKNTKIWFKPLLDKLQKQEVSFSTPLFFWQCYFGKCKCFTECLLKNTSAKCSKLRCNRQHTSRQLSPYLCPDVSHGEPLLLRVSGVAGPRGFSPTALIFSFN